MFGIAPPQLPAHLLVAALPEARQVLGDGRGPPCRGEELHGHGQLALEHRGVGAGPEELLQFHGQHRQAAAVVQLHPATGGHGQARWQEPLQLGAQAPGAVAPQRLLQGDCLQIVAAAQAREPGAEPGLQFGEQPGLAAIGPGIAEVLVGQAEAVLKLAAGAIPGQRLQSQLPQPIQQRPADGLGIGTVPGLAFQHQGSKADAAFAAHPLGFPIPATVQLGTP